MSLSHTENISWVQCMESLFKFYDDNNFMNCIYDEMKEYIMEKELFNRIFDIALDNTLMRKVDVIRIVVRIIEVCLKYKDTNNMSIFGNVLLSTTNVFNFIELLSERETLQWIQDIEIDLKIPIKNLLFIVVDLISIEHYIKNVPNDYLVVYHSIRQFSMHI